MATATATRPFALTSIGKKYIMGITGLIWAGFVFAHMAGNLLIFVGQEAYNNYGHGLTSGYSIYLIETILVAALLAHIFCAISLTIENRAARGGKRYAVTPNGEKGSSLASRTMAFQGSIVLFFIVSHLITFKFGTFYQVGNTDVRDLYKLMVEIFKQPGYVAWYVVSLLLLGAHLSHGVSSIFQSFGFPLEKYAGLIKKVGWIYAGVVISGFLSQPIYIFINN